MHDATTINVPVEINKWFTENECKDYKAAIHVTTNDDGSRRLNVYSDDGQGNGSLLFSFPLESVLLPY